MDISAAEVVSALFGDDGQQWSATVAGETAGMGDVLDVLARDHERSDCGNNHRWTLPDGSAIVVSHGVWDLGFASCEGCFCWPADGSHLETCPHKE